MTRRLGRLALICTGALVAAPIFLPRQSSAAGSELAVIERSHGPPRPPSAVVAQPDIVPPNSPASTTTTSLPATRSLPPATPPNPSTIVTTTTVRPKPAPTTTTARPTTTTTTRRAATSTTARQGSSADPLIPAHPLALLSQQMQADFACIRKAESSGNYQNADTGGNGHYGAYQFSPSTWDGMAAAHDSRWKGVMPNKAPDNVQDQFAIWLQAADGWSPWATAPGCGL